MAYRTFTKNVVSFLTNKIIDQKYFVNEQLKTLSKRLIPVYPNPPINQPLTSNILQFTQTHQFELHEIRPLFLVLFAANGVYFSMSDINVTIPIDKGKFPFNNQPLARFPASGDPPYNYFISSNFLRITPTGDVFFSEKFHETTILSNVKIKPDIFQQSVNYRSGFNNWRSNRPRQIRQQK